MALSPGRRFFGAGLTLILVATGPCTAGPDGSHPLQAERLASVDTRAADAGSSNVDVGVTASLAPQDRIEVAWRTRFAEKFGLDGGHVAVDERSGQPCYMQWLLGPERNEAIARLKSFPRLAAGEALLENAYTPARHRGLGIMSAAMARIAERAAGIGAQHVLTFVGKDNPASLKGCRRAGFAPYLVHTRQDVLFGLLRSDSFEPMADEDPRRDWRL